MIIASNTTIIITAVPHSLKVKRSRKRKVYPSLKVTKMQTLNQKPPGLQGRRSHSQLYGTIIARSQNPTEPIRPQPTERKTIVSSMQLGKTRRQQ